MRSKKIKSFNHFVRNKHRKNCNLSQFFFINWVSPYANLGITQSHMDKAILKMCICSYIVTAGVTFYSFLLCIRAALAPVRQHIRTCLSDPLLSAFVNEQGPIRE